MIPQPFQEALAQAAKKRADQHLNRLATCVDAIKTARIERNGQWLIDFASNDYLGLSGHTKAQQAMKRTVAAVGVGSKASSMVTGRHRIHEQLEHEVADWLHAESALLFSTGYMANLAAITSVLGRHDISVQDKLNHACLIDAAQLSGATLKRYPHTDFNQADQYLATHRGLRMLTTESVFSMDGHTAPLKALAAVAHQHDALLHVDDAHGIGLWGEEGSGTVAYHSLRERVSLTTITLGKAVGGAGGLLVGDHNLIEHIRQHARTYIFSTAMPPALAAANLALVRACRQAEDRRDQLAENIQRFQQNMHQQGIPIERHDHPIQPVLLGENQRALAIGEELREKGFAVGVIRPPTVPKDSARLRISLSASHRKADIDALVNALHQAMHRQP